MEVGKEVLTSWIEGVDVKREVDGVGSTNTILDLLDDAVNTNGIDLTRLDNLKAAVSIILIITWTAQSRADTSVDVGVVGEQTFLSSVVEVCTVVDAGDFAGGATEDLGLPGVEMRVKVDDGDGTISTVDGAEEGESDGVVTSEGDDSWEGFAVLGWSFLLRVGGRFAGEDCVVAFFDLVKGPGVIVSVE